MLVQELNIRDLQTLSLSGGEVSRRARSQEETHGAVQGHALRADQCPSRLPKC